MNSSKTFDDVIQYLESCIADGREIDSNAIARLAASPAALFQRIFSFLAGVSIAEYVRNRKLSLAGMDLKSGDCSVSDVAYKYGFQSPSAFSRAFKEHHGITPSEAKHASAKLNLYRPMNYRDMRFIGGKRVMAEVKKIVYRETHDRLMVGAHWDTSFMEAGAAWQAFFADGTVEEMNRLSGAKDCDDIDSNAGIGMMYHFQDTNRFELIIGDFVRTGTKIPNGLYNRSVPGGLVAYVQIEGGSIPEILESAYFLITEAVEKTDHVIDLEHFFWCEVYTLERYCEPLERGERIIIDYLLPVLPRENKA